MRYITRLSYINDFLLLVGRRVTGDSYNANRVLDPFSSYCSFPLHASVVILLQSAGEGQRVLKA